MSQNRGRINDVKQIKEDWAFDDTCSYKGIKTTIGRVLFNNCLPSRYPFVNKPVDKGTLKEILRDILAKYPADVYADTMDKLKRFGFDAYTKHPASFPIDDLELPPNIEKLKHQLLDNVDDPAEFDKNLQKLIAALKPALKDKGYDIYYILSSGGRGSWGQIAQVLLAKGIVIDPKGNVLKPINTSFADGLNPTGHFKQGTGARSGVIDRALSTAPVGYLTRKMVMASQSVLLGNVEDCKTKRYIQLEVTEDLVGHLYGRYTTNGDLITPRNSKRFVGKVIKLRSPICCKSPKICKTCYGHLYSQLKTNYIGMVAAQTFGERGLQITMRTFHVGGVVSYVVCDILKEFHLNNLSLNIDILSKYVRQDKDELLSTCVQEIQLILKKDDYNIVGSLDIDKGTGKVYCTRAFYATLRIGKLDFDISVIRPVQISVPISEQTDSEYIFNIPPKGSIIKVKQSVDSFSQGIDAINRIFDAKIPFKTPEQLLMALWGKYKSIAGDVDLVHLEVIVSNLLRCKQTPALPARLCKVWSPKQYPIRQIPFVDGRSWLLGLAFENASKAISTGLVTPIKPTSNNFSPIEKIVLGLN